MTTLNDFYEYASKKMGIPIEQVEEENTDPMSYRNLYKYIDVWLDFMEMYLEELKETHGN